jgi:hypothetical protein
MRTSGVYRIGPYQVIMLHLATERLACVYHDDLEKSFVISNRSSNDELPSVMSVFHFLETLVENADQTQVLIGQLSVERKEEDLAGLKVDVRGDGILTLPVGDYPLYVLAKEKLSAT